MNFGSLFSGIGGFDLGLERSGMECAWQAENDPKASAILKHHWPNVVNYGDVRNVRRGTAQSVDLICGGFPCQDLSIAGRRKGLAGKRSGLWYEFARVIDELEPAGVLIENVPGLLSSDEGRDFEIIIRWLAERGYGVAWRVFDSQYFGVAQRRRRVFIVGSLGSGRASQILFESTGVSWDPPARREARKVSPALTASGVGAGRTGNERNETLIDRPLAYNIQHNDGGNHKRKDRPNGGLYVTEADQALTVGTTDLTTVLQDTVGALQERDSKGIGTTIDDKIIAFSADMDGSDAGELAPTLRHGGDEPSDHSAFKKPAIAWNESAGGGVGGNGIHIRVESTHSIGSYLPRVGARRLTPVECERLQGFPDGWTAGQADTVRYRQLGNAVTVPVIEWIGKRIKNSVESGQERQ